MDQYTQLGDFYGVSYITGPSHVHLRIKFGGSERVKPRIAILPARNSHAERKLDEGLVRNSVLAGVQIANRELGSAYLPARIAFVPDDSPRYEIFQHCAMLIVRRLHERGDFEIPDSAPYTREELQKVNERDWPLRGEVCLKCDTIIPQFADFREEDRSRILNLISTEQRVRAIRELRAAVGCSLGWAKIWVVHSGRADAAGKTVPCPYCGKPLMTARARQCQHCNMDWHDPTHPIRLGA